MTLLWVVQFIHEWQNITSSQQTYSVETTSLQRCCNVDVVTTLCVCWVRSDSESLYTQTIGAVVTFKIIVFYMFHNGVALSECCSCYIWLASCFAVSRIVLCKVIHIYLQGVYDLSNTMYIGQHRFCLFVLRFYGPVNPMGHVERGQFT